MTAFIDIETTGLIPKGADWRTDYNQFPYILSVAIVSPEGDNKIRVEKEWFIKNEGVEITPEITKINGITQEIINEKGFPAKEVLQMLISNLILSTKVAAHNAYFDSSIIKANVLRHFGPDSDQAKKVEIALHKDKRIDTVRLAQKKFGGKYISLSDLYFKLFNETFEAHSALNDVIALERVYNELK